MKTLRLFQPILGNKIEGDKLSFRRKKCQFFRAGSCYTFLRKICNTLNFGAKSLKFVNTTNLDTPELDFSVSSQTSKKIDTVGSFFQRLAVAFKEMARSLYFSFDFGNNKHACDLSKFMEDHQYQYSYYHHH